MKKILLILLFIFSINSFAQKIEKNELDEFTKDLIIETEWQTLTSEFGGYSYFRIKKINDFTFLELRFFLKDGFYSIKKGDKLMLMKENKDVFEIYAIDHYISCIGCASVGLVGSKAFGIRPAYIISEESLNQLKKSKIIKFRIYTADGYRDFELTEKKDKRLKDAILNIENAFKKNEDDL